MIRRYPEILAIAALIAVTLGHVIYYELTLTGTNLATGLPDGKLTMAQSKSIDTILEVSHLMIGWAVAIIGAMAFFIRLNIEKDIPLERLALSLSSIVVILCVLSLYYGHFGIYVVAEMLSLDQFPIRNAVTKEVFGRQYMTVLGATGLFGLHVILFCWQLVGRRQ